MIMSRKRKRTKGVISESDGTRCEMCGWLATVIKRKPGVSIRDTHFYTQWYKCENSLCHRRIFFKNEHKMRSSEVINSRPFTLFEKAS